MPHADFVTTTTHKTLRGPRGGMVMCRAAHAKALDRVVFPGIQGGPLMHVIAAKAVAFREAQTPAWRAYQRQIVENAQGPRRALMLARGFRLVSGGTDTHLLLVDLTRPGRHRQGRGGGARPCLDHRRTRTASLRHQGAHGHERDPHRHARRHHARHEGGGDGADRAKLIDRVLGKLGDAATEAAVRAEVQELTSAASRSTRSGSGPMRCPFCGHTEDRVVDSRVGRDGEFIRRRRECLKCHRRYTTYEYIEDVLPHVVKRDNRREPFDRQKLRGSILKACEKRSVGVQAVDDVVAEIETKLHERAEKEITPRSWARW